MTVTKPTVQDTRLKLHRDDFPTVKEQLVAIARWTTQVEHELVLVQNSVMRPRATRLEFLFAKDEDQDTQSSSFITAVQDEPVSVAMKLAALGVKVRLEI
jgi:hypothetical protein